MPTNLNALIRYKQIDRCLRNRYKPCTIEIMQETCSEALGEFRGVYKKISERTIRHDLQVMRSDMLGFNAPIEFKNGFYLYSDPDYSIFNIFINEMTLLKKVFAILLGIKDKDNEDTYLDVVSELSNITGMDLPDDLKQKIIAESSKPVKVRIRPAKDVVENIPTEINQISYFYPPEKQVQFMIQNEKEAELKFDWRKVFDLV